MVCAWSWERCILITLDSKGPYPLGDFGADHIKFSTNLAPILVLISLWVSPIYWATGQLIPVQPPLLGDWVTADLYQVGVVVNRLVGMGLNNDGFE